MPTRSDWLEEELGGEEAARMVDAMARRILDARRFLITTHINPDGDALGSELALAIGLRRLGKLVRVVNDHHPPKKYSFLDRENLIEVLEGEAKPELSGAVELGILLDTSEPSRTGRLQKEFFRHGLDRICLDHHPGPISSQFLHHWVAEASPATGNLVLRLLDRLPIQIDREIATPLLVATGTDTGWFRFSNTNPIAFGDAARLLEAGAEVESLYRQIYEDFNAERMILMGRLLAGIQMEFDGKFAWSLLENVTLKQSGVTCQDLDGLAEELATIRGVDLVALVVEVDPDSFKMSLRSRGDFSVNAIARDFGGGGHAKAAGFRITGERQEVIAKLLDRVARELSETGKIP